LKQAQACRGKKSQQCQVSTVITIPQSSLHAQKENPVQHLLRCTNTPGAVWVSLGQRGLRRLLPGAAEGSGAEEMLYPTALTRSHIFLM